MKNLRLFFIFIFVVTTNTPTYAQIKEGYYYKDENKDVAKTDSLIRTLDSTLPNSYYAITFPVGEKVTSYGMQLYKSYYSVRNEEKEIVLIISNKGGIRKPDINILLKKLLKIEDQELKKIKVVWDESLYQYIVNGRRLVRLLYIFRNEVYYNENQKLHSLSNYTIPEPTINIKEEKSTKLRDINNYVLKSSDDIFPFKEDHIFVLGDVTNTLFDVDVNTGVTKPFFILSDYFTPYDIFTKEVAQNNTSKYRIAKEHDARLVEGNRQTLQLTQVKYQDNKLFGSFSIEVAEINEKESSYTTDEGKTDYNRKGSTILNHYLFFFCWEPTTRKILWVSEIKNPLVNQVYTNVDCGFYVKDSTVYTGVTRYQTLESEQEHIAEYSISNKKTTFKKYIGPVTKSDKLISNYNFIDFFYEFNGALLYSYTCLGDICQLNKSKAVAKLYGDGSQPYAEQKFKKFNEEVLDLKLNFMVGAFQSIFGEEYILAFYKYKEKYIFELKDILYNTVDIIDASKIKGMESYINQEFRHPYPYGLIIQNDKIHCLILESNELIIKTFSASQY